MSDEWMRKRAKRFRHECDEQYRRFVAPTLFGHVRSEVLEHEYACDLAANDVVATGMPVTLLRSGDDVLVLQGNRSVGRVSTEEKQSISSALDAGCGVLRGIVTTVALIGDLFHIKLDEAV